MNVIVTEGSRAKRARAYRALIITVLQYARINRDAFIFGPVNEDRLLETGLLLEGDIEGVSSLLQRHFHQYEYLP